MTVSSFSCLHRLSAWFIAIPGVPMCGFPTDTPHHHPHHRAGAVHGPGGPSASPPLTAGSHGALLVGRRGLGSRQHPVACGSALRAPGLALSTPLAGVSPGWRGQRVHASEDLLRESGRQRPSGGSNLRPLSLLSSSVANVR